MYKNDNLAVGDTIIYKPLSYSCEYQPFTIAQIEDRQYVLKGKYWRALWVRKLSPLIFKTNPDIPLEEQYKVLYDKLIGRERTWETLLAGEYYRRYGGGGFAYYKILTKAEPSPENNYYRIIYKYKRSSDSELHDGIRRIEYPKAKLWGKNFKLVAKLEGLMAMGE